MRLACNWVFENTRPNQLFLTNSVNQNIAVFKPVYDWFNEQLIFTTHDLMLMDQNILRRDEMWVMERDEKESTQLYAISDYKDLRYDCE